MKAYDKRQIRRILTLEWGLGSRSRSLKTINWEHNKLFQDPRRHYKNMAWCKPCWSNRKTPLTRWTKLLQNIISDLLNDTFYNKTYCLEDVNGQNPVQKTTLKCTTSMFTVNVRPCADRVYVTHMARIRVIFRGPRPQSHTSCSGFRWDTSVCQTPHHYFPNLRVLATPLTSYPTSTLVSSLAIFEYRLLKAR